MSAPLYQGQSNQIARIKALLQAYDAAVRQGTAEIPGRALGSIESLGNQAGPMISNLGLGMIDPSAVAEGRGYPTQPNVLTSKLAAVLDPGLNVPPGGPEIVRQAIGSLGPMAAWGGVSGSLPQTGINALSSVVGAGTSEALKQGGYGPGAQLVGGGLASTLTGMGGGLAVSQMAARKSKAPTDIFGSAIKKQGLTDNLDDAAFILPDGKLLKFKNPNYQVHEDVAFQGMSKNKEQNLEKFLKSGAIRVKAGYGNVHIAIEPTPAQYRVLKQISDMNDGLSIDYGGISPYASEGIESFANPIAAIRNKFKPLSTDIFEVAKKNHGTTEDFGEAGYILPDGEMLDFSGKADGGQPGMRAYDHRQIQYPGSDQMDSGYERMMQFINKGAIRVHFSTDGPMVDMAIQPTRAQERTLSRMFSEAEKGPLIDFNDLRHGRTNWREFNTGGEALRGIREHFGQGGE